MGSVPSVSYDTESASGLVDEQVGDVYTNVKTVAANIEAVVTVAENIPNIFNSEADAAASATAAALSEANAAQSETDADTHKLAAQAFADAAGASYVNADAAKVAAEAAKVAAQTAETNSETAQTAAETARDAAIGAATAAGTSAGNAATSAADADASADAALAALNDVVTGLPAKLDKASFTRVYVENLVGIAIGSGKTGAQRTSNRTLINAQLATGVRLYIRPGTVIEIDQSLIFADNSGLIGEAGAVKPVIYMPAAQFTNTNNGAGTRYGTNAVGLNLSGQTVGPFTSRKNVVINNIHVQSETTMGRYLRGIVGQNIENCHLWDVEVSGIPTGVGIALSSAVNCSIMQPYVHDFNDTTATLAAPQSTGIEFDNDVINAVTSKRTRVDQFRIYNIWGGGNLLTASGLQTDGINIANSDSAIDIGDGWISKVGEGIDTFGSGTIGNVRLEDCYNYGLKFIHGASKNVCGVITVIRPGIAGVCFMGSSQVARDTSGNTIASLTVSNVNPTNAWPAADTACVLFDDNVGTTGKPKNNVIGTAHLDTGANGKYAWLDRSNGSRNVGQNISILTGAGILRRVYIPNNAGSVKTTEMVYFKATATGQAVVTTTDTALTWQTEVEDVLGMHAANSDTVTVPYSGWYDLAAHVRFDINATGVRILKFMVQGVVRTSWEQRPAINGRECYLDLRERVYLTAGDAIKVIVYHDAGVNLNANGGPSWFQVELIREA